MSIVLPISVYEDDKYNDLRRGYLLLIGTLINEYIVDGDINDHIDMIIDIEKSCYDHSVEVAEYELLSPDFEIVSFQNLYRTKVMRITKNLDVNSEVGDEHLATSLLDGSIDPKMVSKLSNKDLSPMRNQKLVDALNDRLNQKITVKTSSLYRCRQCGKRETTVRSAQLRALDEGQSILIQCQFCHYRWII